MSSVLFDKDGRIGRIALPPPPEVMNAINDDLPHELAAAVADLPGINQTTLGTGWLETGGAGKGYRLV